MLAAAPPACWMCTDRRHPALVSSFIAGRGSPRTHLNVREERVAKPRALCGALDEPRNVGDMQVRRDLGRRLPLVAEVVEALVRHGAARLVGVDRAEGEIFGGGRLVDRARRGAEGRERSRHAGVAT